ncbi:D-aminoacyl-tRNA deacylase [soil metagenome]
MRTVIQRVSRSTVHIGGQLVGATGVGLVVLLGIGSEDTGDDIDWLVGKIARLRVFPDEAGLMNRSLDEVGGEVLVISQFTLHASTKKGNRPSYLSAARPEAAEPLYAAFVTRLADTIARPVATGRFGAEMQLTLTNEGPVTITIDSRNRE